MVATIPTNPWGVQAPGAPQLQQMIRESGLSAALRLRGSARPARNVGM